MCSGFVIVRRAAVDETVTIQGRRLCRICQVDTWPESWACHVQAFEYPSQRRANRFCIQAPDAHGVVAVGQRCTSVAMTKDRVHDFQIDITFPVQQGSEAMTEQVERQAAFDVIPVPGPAMSVLDGYKIWGAGTLLHEEQKSGNRCGFDTEHRPELTDDPGEMTRQIQGLEVRT